jgi:hypothetical protein
MTPFEYVSVLISIILGLGIAVLLTGLADIIRNYHTVKVYWPYLVWILIVFILHIQEWWISYSLRSEMEWTLPHFLFIITYPIVLFILAHLLFPQKWTKKGVDLKVFYFNNFPKYFGAALLLLVLSILQNHFLLNYLLADQYVQFIMAFFFLALLGTRSKKEVLHMAMALLMLTLLILSFVVAPDQLLLK